LYDPVKLPSQISQSNDLVNVCFVLCSNTDRTFLLLLSQSCCLLLSLSPLTSLLLSSLIPFIVSPSLPLSPYPHYRADTSFPLWEWGGREKNWSPMVYNNTVLFVRQINPLTVVSQQQLITPYNNSLPCLQHFIAPSTPFVIRLT